MRAASRAGDHVLSAVGVDVGAPAGPVDLSAASGQWVGVTGPSGSGKTVLLEAIAGVRRPRRGQVLLDGAPVVGPEDFGVVLQSVGLVPSLTVAETVALPLQVARLPRAEIRRRTGERLADLGLTTAAERLVSQLSGGQRQRVAVAAALAPRPVALLLDEPTAELDAANRARILDLLDAERLGGAIVVVAAGDEETLARSQVVIDLGAAVEP